jgi:ribosome-associated heat shock protein Hsp15
MRIDKLLWYLRFAASRTSAQTWVTQGHIRLNGRRIERPSSIVHAGDLLVLPMQGGVRVIKLVAFPIRRGPVPEARECYRVLDAAAISPLADVRIVSEGLLLP